MQAKPLFSLLAAVLLAPDTPRAQTIAAPFATNYTFRDLGSIPGVPSNLGGIAFLSNDPNTLLIGGAANGAGGAIYAVPVTRDPQARITGFGTPVQHATAPYIDGGLCYGPGGVLFATGYPVNTLMQFRPASTSPDSTITLTGPGVASSVGTCQFVPSGFPGAGRFKIASYNASTWYDVVLSPNATGTFDVVGVGPTLTIAGGPEGILYPPPGSPQLPDFATVLISEYSGGSIGVYDLDANGDPIPASRRDFMTGLGGAEGAVVDPVSGDMLFSTFGGGNRVIAIGGFAACGYFQNYGQGCPGTNGIPQLGGTGCPILGANITIEVTNGRPGATGQLGFGPRAINVPILSCTLLVDTDVRLPVVLDGGGAHSFATTIPSLPIFSGWDAYWQAGFLDSGAPIGIAVTPGLRMFIL